MAKFTPHTPEQIEEMLEVSGKKCIEELFEDIPGELRTKKFSLPSGLTECEAFKVMKNLAGMNKRYYVSFLGGGFYDHYIPAAVESVASKPEFFTAYTPYQPEASQGTLQAVFEYQTMAAKLTGMDVANASLYDGGTALYEAVVMAVRSTRRSKIIIDEGINPLFRRMLKTHVKNLDIQRVNVRTAGIKTDKEKLINEIDENTAAVVAANPNFFGHIDDYSDVFEKAAQKGALSVLCFYPMSLGVLKTPGEMGADIAVGEGQGLGMPLSFGGPYLGIIAASKKYARKLPGRIAGETTDTEGKRAYVLTLQAREQHIRREKATSNICSNQALCALKAAVYMSLLGKRGFRDTALINMQKAHRLRNGLKKIKGIKVIEGSFFNEFAVEVNGGAKAFVNKMLIKGFVPGLPAGLFYLDKENILVVNTTEKRTDNEMNMFLSAAQEAMG
ncbi:MAG: aminomethyl-transferring glycine dehydrogenase subunit GcvPA [Candidatus Goldiibacteriota bacterium]